MPFIAELQNNLPTGIDDPGMMKILRIFGLVKVTATRPVQFKVKGLRELLKTNDIAE